MYVFLLTWRVPSDTLRLLWHLRCHTYHQLKRQNKLAMAVWQWWYWTVFTLATQSADSAQCAHRICVLVYSIMHTRNIGYMMKWRGIQDITHGNQYKKIFRHPKCVVPGHLIQFPRWSKSHMSPRSRQDHRYLHPAIILGQYIVWMIMLVITSSLCYFPVVV